MTLEPIPLPVSLTPHAATRNPDDEGVIFIRDGVGFLKGVPVPVLAMTGYMPATLAEVYGLTATDLHVIDAYVAGYAQGRQDVAATFDARRQQRQLRKARRLRKLLAVALDEPT